MVSAHPFFYIISFTKSLRTNYLILIYSVKLQYSVLSTANKRREAHS